MLIEYGENKNLIVAKGFLMTHDEFNVLLKRLIEVTKIEKNSACRNLMKHTLFLDETGYDVTFDIPNILVYSKMLQVEEDSNVEIISLNELKDELKQKKKMRKENEIDVILKDTIKELILEYKIKYWISTKDIYAIDTIMGKTDIKQLTFVANQRKEI
jgi:hypothetical protein